MTLNELMDYAISEDCSDVHITVGTNLAVRRYGTLHILEDKPTAEESLKMIYDILSEENVKRIEKGQDVDFGLTYNEDIRLRVNVYHQRNNLAASIRILMRKIPDIEDLGLPYVIKQLAEAPNGIIIVTGPTGSGKTTTLAAVVDYINKTQAKHVITVEDPIEYIYPHNKAMIHQRELGKDTPSYAHALHSALREDPDIILVGEMRDFATISAAITAAETGHLVLSTLHTTSAAQTIDRIIDGSPVDQQETIRQQFAMSVRGVISQQLLPTVDGNARVLATEIMIGNMAISNLIRENKTVMINSAIQSGHKEGMHTLNESLLELYRQGQITRKVALNASNDPTDFDKALGGGTQINAADNNFIGF
ncbi:MAG: PilT/PilU family type 4a pilus ATPase [Saccharofermentans sp.]|nr:PilT/PilU family type 4a pilus ATPase [Saccharofermentans sp.]